MREAEFPFGELLSPEVLEKRVRLVIGRPDVRVVLQRRSEDFRKGILYRYKVDILEPGEEPVRYELRPYRDVRQERSVIVVGSGPAGMFASLRLLMEGFRPIILERGKDVHSRKSDAARLSREGKLDPDSNYCFGEGGAGTFSDGKLYTRSSKRGDNREVLEQLVNFGADSSILYDSHPHIGSDKLPGIVENIRLKITECGGEYHFSSRVTSVRKTESGFEVECADGRVYKAGAVILATGHSARDVYEMLLKEGGRLEAKGFALGVRVEHPQTLINRARSHGAWKPGMPAADYNFVSQVDGRGVFSFCMCPGGVLVPSSTQEETVVLNGMSGSSRSSRWANAGVVVQVEPEDVPGDDPLRLLDFQQKVERDMFICARKALGEGNAISQAPGAAKDHPFIAPGQRMTDFCQGRLSKSLPESSYRPGAVSARLDEALPPFVASRLKKAFTSVNIPSYYTEKALLLGTESRTSSPVRIPRDNQTLQYISIPGLFPAGEGAGYSGGIVSSAIDGIRAAESAAQYLGK